MRRKEKNSIEILSIYSMNESSNVNHENEDFCLKIE